MTEELINIAKGVLKDCFYINKDDSVLVVTDTDLYEIGASFFHAASFFVSKRLITIIPIPETPGTEPPQEISELMLKYSIIIAPTTMSLSHTEARRQASKNGARIATLPGITLSTFKRTLSVNYKKLAQKTLDLAEHLKGAEKIRITSPSGTDITMSVKDRTFLPDTGVIKNRGDFSNLPAGEVYTAPVEGSAEGIIVVDGSMGDSGILGDRRITIEVENGIAKKIYGCDAADRLREAMEGVGPCAKNLAELGIGTNPNARISGSVLEDEKIAGTVHLAFGDNRSMGGNVECAFHVDGVILNPTIYKDDNLFDISRFLEG